MKQEIIIIGAGIIGLATAERLLIQGAKVTILERNKAGKEASWAGGGILSPLFPWNYSAAVAHLAGYSARQFPAWASALHQSTGIDPEYEISGMLILSPFDGETARLWCSEQGISMKSHSAWDIHSNSTGTHAPGEVLKKVASDGQARRNQVKKRSLQVVNDHFACDFNTVWPNAAVFQGFPRSQDSALFLPDVAQIRNPRLLRALRSRVELLGGKIIENCTVNRFKTAHQRIQAIDSSRGEYAADYYIVCAGAWSKEVLEAHAPGLNIRPIKGQMLLFKFDAPPIRSIIVQNDVYLIPRRDGHLLVGSTLEDTGFDKQTTAAARDYLLQHAQAILPALQGMPLTQHWSGLRPASPENIPTIGRHPDIHNLLINSGHFRYGVTMAPASAEILVNEVTGASQPIDTTPYQAGWSKY